MWRLFIQVKIIHKAGRNGFKLAVLQQVNAKVGMTQTVPLYAGVLLHTADNIKAALLFSFSTSCCIALINTEKPSLFVNSF